MKKRAVLGMALAAVLALSGCKGGQNGQTEENKPAETTSAADKTAAGTTNAGAEAANDPQEEKELNILVMPKLVGIPWFNASDVGAERAGGELGVNVIYAGPTQADAAEQVKMIEDYMNKGSDAICIAPNDPAAIKPVLNSARDAGILVMDWDTPADKEDVDYSVNSVDPVEYGQAIWDCLVEAMGTDSGQYAVITGGLEAAGLNMWIDAGLEYAKVKYPNLELVTERIPSDEQQQVAYQRALELVKTYPDLKGIIGVSTPAPLGAAQAIQEKGLQNQVAVVGGTLPNDASVYLKDGSMDFCIVEANPETLGYATAYVAAYALQGKEIATGLEIPGVGPITVQEDGKTIILGPPLIVDGKNVDDYDF